MRFAACLSAGLLVTTALAGEPAMPSVELLLYLADWEPDAQGDLVDPLDVPAETDLPIDRSYAEAPLSNSPSMEYPR